AEPAPGQRRRRLPVGAPLPPPPDPALGRRREGVRLEARAGRSGAHPGDGREDPEGAGLTMATDRKVRNWPKGGEPQPSDRRDTSRRRRSGRPALPAVPPLTPPPGGRRSKA